MIPGRIVVGPQIYRRVDSAPSGDPSPRGETNNRLGLFFVAKELSLTQQQDTLLHEVLHMIWDNMPRIDLSSTKDVEEAIVSFYAPWLLKLLQDNPEVVTFLLAR